MILQVLIAMIAGWINRHRQHVSTYLSGVASVVLPPQSPNFNAHCERFGRSIKEEVVGRMIFMGEASLRYTLTQYWAHYHAECNHQGLNTQLIVPEPEVSKQNIRAGRAQSLDELKRRIYARRLKDVDHAHLDR